MSIPGKDRRLTSYGGTNLGMDLSLAGSLIVPNDLFFVRSNSDIPLLAPEEWTVTIDGAVANPVEIAYTSLVHLPSVTLTAFLECTGNGRSRFSPTTEGTPWLNDAAGNAVWRGVPLAELLAFASPLPGAVDVVSQGADLDSMRRGLPMPIALDRNVLLVYEMNGAPLPPAHGGPVRLFVPGWAGVASTKWLTRLEVWERPFTGEFQGDLYVLYDEDGTPVAPITQMPVKSVISRPSQGVTVDPGNTSIEGYAWSGYGGIAAIEISVNDGAWEPALITEQAGPRSWCRWTAFADLPAGRVTIAARATDERGIQQPRKARWNQKGYLMNEIHVVEIDVRAGS